MKRLKILTVVGARPQLIKAAAVSRVIAETPATSEVLVHTGQHHDPEMSDVFFQQLGLPRPAHHLGIAGGSHGQMTGRMMMSLETTLREESPDVVVVFGDTNSTLAGALVATKAGVPLVHVEAGLRSFDRTMPEEVNRVVTDHVSDLLLCPTLLAVNNLAGEGITRGVEHVGDVMYDVALEVAQRRPSNLLALLAVEPRRYAVATVHRAANTDDAASLGRIVAYLREATSNLPVILPLHPRTQAAADRFGVSLEGITVRPPLGYFEMAELVRSAACVYTDSGGLQKEAYFHRVPCVTMRDKTEWEETIEAGWNRLWTVPDYRSPRREIAEYGDGHAAGAVLTAILAAFG